MHLNSKVSPVYLPEPDQRSVLRLGLKRLDPRQWLIRDADFATFYQNKLAGAERHADKVYRALPGSEPAQQELRALILDHLVQDHGEYYRVQQNRLIYQPAGISFPLDEQSLSQTSHSQSSRSQPSLSKTSISEPSPSQASLFQSSLWQTSLWVQEDLCILEPHDGTFTLTAASVCAPSNWKLEDKIGCSLDQIHGPVPGYGRELSRRVNRLFTSLKPDKPLFRFNWSIQTAPELYWRDLLPAAEGMADGKEKRFWRVERQTLRRLPKTGAVIFGIRIFIHSFADLQRLPHFASSIDAILDNLPEDQRRYKGLLGS